MYSIFLVNSKETQTHGVNYNEYYILLNQDPLNGPQLLHFGQFQTQNGHSINSYQLT